MSNNNDTRQQPEEQGTEPLGNIPVRAEGDSGLSGVAIRRPVFTTMMMLGLIVLGIFGFRRLAIDEFPDVEIPIVVVQTVYPGASPETIEREVTERLELAFNPVEGVDRITSQSLEGVSLVIIEFDLDRNVDQASQDVRAKIDAIRRDLPLDIDPPVVQKFDPAAQPILSLAISSDQTPIVELTRLADDVVRRRLEAVSGVGEARLAGGLQREIRVFLLPDQMQSLGISVGEVMAALQQQNLEVPAGRLERGNEEQLVRVTGRLQRPEQFGEIIVANRMGNPIRLKQVARVEDATEEERSLALVNGQRAVAIDVLKVQGANTVAVADAVMEAVAELEEVLPAGVAIQVVRDNSVNIRQSVDDAIHELILGAILTVIIVMIFLNDWKATVITSLVLPISVISSFMLMDFMGFSLNMISLMALALSIGILIDDAIVVIENIVRHRQMGKDYFTAARVGTKEIFLAVMATTFSIVAVFVPVAFMGGIIGRFFYQFGLTVAFAVLVSLFVSFTLTPMLSAWWGVDPHVVGHTRGNVLTRAISRFNDWFDRQAKHYRGIIEWALGHRKTTMGVAVGSLVGAFMLFPFIGGAFMPPADSSQFMVNFETTEGSSLAYARSKAEQLIAEVNQLPGVEYSYTTIGAGLTGTVNSGSIYVKLVSPGEREHSQAALIAMARERLTPIFGVEVQVLEAGGVGGAQAPLSIEIRGPDTDELQRLSDMLVPMIGDIPGVVDVRSSLGAPLPEYRIDVDRDLANELGLNVGQIANVVRPVLAGVDATRWEDPTGEERDVVVQVAPEQRTSVEDIATIPVTVMGATGSTTIPLGQVATIERGEAPSQIDRSSLQRLATISAATTADVSLAEASTAIAEMAAGLDLPAGYSVTLGGETEQLQETVGYVIEAIVLAVILIFLILASQFESFTQPFAIMLSLPLSLIGVLLALLITNDTLNMMSMIGVILLFGLVTKNAILLVDNANERRRAGIDRWTALVEAGEVRLRPIIMTTLAMIFGMLPVALAMGEGGGFRAPMARAVIGGLITSTLLTLIVVPVAYTYFDDFGNWVRSKFVSPEREKQLREDQEHAGLAPEPVWGD